jgi:segregation and condensation protein B
VGGGVDLGVMSEHSSDSTAGDSMAGESTSQHEHENGTGPGGEVLAEGTDVAAGGGVAAAVVVSAGGHAGASGHAAGKSMPGAAEITGDIEAMILSIGRAIPPVKLAVALGMIAPEAAEEAAAQAAVAAAPAVGESGEQVAGGEGGDAAAVPVATPVKPKRKGKAKSGPQDAEAIIEKAVAILNEQYEKSGRSFRIERIAGGYRFMTLAKHARAVASLHQERESVKLSRPAIETLAIIAYRQPITRAELEAIRGVACGEVIRSLMERRLIAIVGRSEELGRPMLYGTTKHFLDAFGLATLKDLPSAQDLKTAL